MELMTNKEMTEDEGVELMSTEEEIALLLAIDETMDRGTVLEATEDEGGREDDVGGIYSPASWTRKIHSSSLPGFPSAGVVPRVGAGAVDYDTHLVSVAILHGGIAGESADDTCALDFSVLVDDGVAEVAPLTASLGNGGSDRVGEVVVKTALPVVEMRITRTSERSRTGRHIALWS